MDTRLNTIASILRNIINKNWSLIIRKLFRKLFKNKCVSRSLHEQKLFLDDSTNRLALSGEASKARSEISRGRDFGEKERGERRERERELATMVTFNESSMFVLSHPYSQSRTLYDARTIGENRENRRYPRNNGLSIAVSCQRVRVARSQFTEHTRVHVSFDVPDIHSAISCYIFTFLSSAISSIFSRNMKDQRIIGVFLESMG